MYDQRSIVPRVASACRAEGLLETGERVLVAVSGGADSTALALLLDAVRAKGVALDLVLAHLDHGWRGPAEAEADRRVVAAVADRIGAPLVVEPPPAEAVRTEDAARRWRYQVLDRLARAHGCPKVATGHHVRDQAETVLMRLERGSGRVGLRGIPTRRPLGEHGVEVVRPLLGIDPRELRAWLDVQGVAWSEDATNADLSRDRARARARLLAVEARGGRASHDLAAFANRLAARVARDETELDRALGAALTHHPHVPAVEVPRAALAALRMPLLDLALRRLGRALDAERDGPFFTRRHLALVRDLLEGGGGLDLPRGLHVDVSPTRVWLRRIDETPDLPRLRVALRERATFDLDAFLAGAGSRRAALDADVLGEAPAVRSVAADDIFVPWGREPERTVGVLDWLARRQVPAWLRARLPVVVGRRGVAWVPGYRIDRRHAVRADSPLVACLELARP